MVCTNVIVRALRSGPDQPEENPVKSILCFLICFLGFVAQCDAATPASTPKVATTITSDSMNYDPGTRQVTFQGNVHVTRDDFQIWSEKLIIYFSKEIKNKQSQGKNASATTGQDLSEVEKIVALQKVRIVSQGKKGFCEKTTYWQKNGLMQMEGNPRLEDGENQIQGEIIKLYTLDNRSEVLGGKKRVEAIFYSRPDKVK